MVVEVEADTGSLDEEDVFVLDKGDKIWVWQGKNASPMEKAKAAQVVNDLTLAKHVDVEVLSQTEPRAKIVSIIIFLPSLQESRSHPPQHLKRLGGTLTPLQLVISC